MTSLLFRFEIAARTALVALALGLFALPSQGAPTDLNDIPMAVSNQVKANFLMILDNSQSMDALMGGALQSGDNPDTRGNTGRKVLRGMLGDEYYRSKFKWGLMSFDAPSPSVRYIHAYYMGDKKSMVFTDQCVAGISATNGKPCVANPQPFVGGEYVTYDKSSDDPSILDALYDTEKQDVIWGFSPAGSQEGSSTYDFWLTHTPGNGASWAVSEFADHWYAGSFTPTDAGFLPKYPDVSRQLFLYRGWGFRAGITGGGKLWEEVLPDSNAHFDKLNSLLGPETDKNNTLEIKNAALFTPLAGTLKSVKDYFQGQSDWKSAVSYTSPITAYCQKNFVMLVTDGLPTGKSDGTLYSQADRTDTCSVNSSSCTGGAWTFGTAANDAFNAVIALRTVPYTGCTDCTKPFDVKTYVIAMGDTVSNARAVAVMNRMADEGGKDKEPKNPPEPNPPESKTAFFASDPKSLQESLDAVVQDAVSTLGAASAVAVANANVTATTQSFQSSYESGSWTGELESYYLDLSTGLPLTGSPPIWTARGQLDALVPASRKIVSYNGVDHGIQFQPTTAGTTTTLSSAQQDLLSTTDGAGIVNFIRGDRTAEGTKYRKRGHVLGDIVNSEPVVVAASVFNYKETTDPGYGAFKAAHASRQAIVFQGANDGMLHAFNADTGAEAWAYVPTFVLPTLANLSELHGFSHKYYVDGTPTAGDVDFARTGGATGTPDWRTILVGGLGKGGRGYYALDITNGIPATEADAAARVLWEFPNASTDSQVVANLGYSFGRPIITKAGDRGWVVLVTSGYNNTTGDGDGHLFVLNAKTGALIEDIPTGVCETTQAECLKALKESPSGLAAFSGYVQNVDADNTVTQVYAGDLLGNVWRFDLTGESSFWNVAKLATLVDASGNPQPVTTAPELASIFEINAVYRFVYVGTGQYLGDSDVTTTATQTMYGLVDDRSTTPLIDPLRLNLQQQTFQSDPNYRTATSYKFALSGTSKKRGWYIDLPALGERISTDPQLALGTLVFTSNIPSGVQCVPGGSSYLNMIDYRTGGALDPSPWSSRFLGNALASRPILIQLPDGKVRAVIRLSDDPQKPGSGAVNISDSVVEATSLPKIRRVSWRELPDQ